MCRSGGLGSSCGLPEVMEAEEPRCSRPWLGCCSGGPRMQWHCKHVEVLTGGDSTEAVFALCCMPRGEAEVTTWHSCMPGRLEQADMLLGITGMQHWQSPATTGSHSFYGQKLDGRTTGWICLYRSTCEAGDGMWEVLVGEWMWLPWCPALCRLVGTMHVGIACK